MTKCLMVILVLWISAIIYYWIYWTAKECSADYLILSLIPMTILEMISSSCSALIFIMKLYQLLKINEIHNNIETQNKNINTDTNLENVKSLKYIVYKLSILATVTLLSSSILVIGMLVFDMNGLFAIDTMINTICLMLSFLCYDKYYKQLCCLCRKRCVDA
eukprot:440819_1